MPNPTIAFVGAGSTVFAKNLLGDVLSTPELAGSDIRLFDIDPKRLDLSKSVADRVAETLGASPRLTATTDRERALDGADYVLSMIQVAGYRPGTVRDFEIPARYGLRQTIGDTLGVGGIMRALRTIPVMQGVVRDMERLCPSALHLNYVNPMAMVTWALNASSSVQTVGLCHSVQGTAKELAADLDVDAAEIDFLAAGINHMAFYLRFERDGVDLYPALRRVRAEGRAPEWNRVRYEMLERLGYFVTESSEHFAEYVPWFIKEAHPELLERFAIPLDEYLGRCQLSEVTWPFVERELREPGSLHHDDLRRAIRTANVQAMPRTIAHTLEGFERFHAVERSVEYGATIIEAIETRRPAVIYGNVPNHGLIDGLPDGCCVEVPCLVDENGVQPVRVGALPPQLTALMRTNVNVQELTVAAILQGKREHVYHAAMLDPHTSSELTLDAIHALVDDLLAAHADLIPRELVPDALHAL
ncbi:MAG: alpha-glucosidase/alpha-galactosidase [Trueperaceae bacterium]|nr:MAG: alpha-glucosidase/alpha-galactosidase [Trueperaceae bacterium]